MTGAAFKGWIPCVSGALSFSAFGEVSHRPRATTANRTDGLSRYLISYRRKDCSDVLLPFRTVLSPLLLKLRGKLWFVCVGKAVSVEGTTEALAGMVYLITDDAEWQKAERLLHEYQSRLRAFSVPFASHSLSQAFDPSFEELREGLKPLSGFNAEFTVARTGETGLRVSTPMTKSASAPSMPDDPVQKDHIEHVVTAQLFFFLRDIGHRHQHHNPNTDTIVDLYRFDGDEFTWRSRTLFALYRKIIGYKRIKTEHHFSSSLGVIAYARSFRAVSEAVLDDNAKARLPRFFSENVEASIKAIAENSKRIDERKARFTSALAQYALSALALGIAAVGVFQITEVKLSAKPAQFLFFLAELLITQPLTFFGIICGVWVGAKAIAGPRDIGDQWLVRKVLRFVQPFPIAVPIALLTIFTTIASIAVAKLL